MPPRFRRIRALPLLLVGVLGVLLIGCGSGAATPADGAGAVTLRLGYFPNITHAQPIVGLADGTFAQELGPNVKLETKTFNAGPSAIEALFAGAIDATYIGPNPAITGFVQSGGKDIRIQSIK